jgi:hypothetical protein
VGASKCIEPAHQPLQSLRSAKFSVPHDEMVDFAVLDYEWARHAASASNAVRRPLAAALVRGSAWTVHGDPLRRQQFESPVVSGS